jgi:predicted AAA+ superfamily ATPase
MYIIQRHLETLRGIAPGKAVIICGARRTGRTTLLRQFLRRVTEPYLLFCGEDIELPGADRLRSP